MLSLADFDYCGLQGFGQPSCLGLIGFGAEVSHVWDLDHRSRTISHFGDVFY